MKNDSISRQAAIKAICEDGTMLERQGKYTMTMAERKQKDADILDTLPPAQPREDIRAMCGECDAWNKYKNYLQPGWIPCSERLPEKSGNYLVTTSDGQVELKYYSTFYRWQGWVDMIAWMPLPTPYHSKGEKE